MMTHCNLLLVVLIVVLVTSSVISQRANNKNKCNENPSQSFTLGIMMFDQVEVLDFAGPFEVFAVAGEMFGKFKVSLIGDKKHITARNGMNVIVDHVIGERGFPNLNVIVVPGSNRSATLSGLNNPVFVKWIKDIEPKLDYIISVCTGVSFLCRAGLVDNMNVTTHHQAFDFVQEECPKSTFVRGRRFVDNGRILTSAGISAGIDVSLHFVKRRHGKVEASAVAERMEYEWRDSDNSEVCAQRQRQKQQQQQQHKQQSLGGYRYGG